MYEADNIRKECEIARMDRMNCVFSCLQIFASEAAIVKHILTKCTAVDEIWRTNAFATFFMVIVCWGIAIVLCAGMMLFLVPFAVFKIFVIVILRALHRSNYGGVFGSVDGLFIVEDETTYNIINIVLLLKFDNSDGNLTNFVKCLCETRFFMAKRMTSVRRFFMGYGYFLYNQLSAEDVVSSIRMSNSGFCNVEDLKRFVQMYANITLPKDNSAACQIVVCEDRVKLGGEEDEEQYAILLRVHHSFADGITLMSMLTQNVADENDSNIPIKLNDAKRSFKSKLRELYNSHAHIHTLFIRKDNNILRKPILSKQKNIALKIEQRGDRLLEKVKRIKKAIPNCTFTSILLTAISASLQDFFKKSSRTTPANLIVAFVAVADKKQIHFMHKELANNFSLCQIKLPIDFGENNSNVNIIERLHVVMEEYQRFNDSYDKWIFHWQFKAVTYLLPRPLVKLLITSNDVATVALSNLPGIKKMYISGNAVNHMMFWIPNFLTTGAGFSLLTYDDRFQMGFLIDECLIPDEAQAQEVLDGVFAYIHHLFDAVSKRDVVS